MRQIRQTLHLHYQAGLSYAQAHPALRLIAQMGELTALRKTDIHMLKLTQINDGLITVKLSKTDRNATGKTLEFDITPAVQAILDQAAKLPGRARSIFVFPTRKGTPYSESGMQSAWRRAKKESRDGRRRRRFPRPADDGAQRSKEKLEEMRQRLQGTRISARPTATI